MRSRVVYPFVDLKRFTGIESFDGGYFVIIGRPNKYKRFDLAIDACKKLGVELKIIDGNLNRQTVVNILAGSKALIIPGEEDFGLTSLEAQALGKPVIAYGAGGALETVIDGKTGIFFDNQTVNSLVSAILKFENTSFKPTDCRSQSLNFSRSAFMLNFSQTVTDLWQNHQQKHFKTTSS